MERISQHEHDTYTNPFATTTDEGSYENLLQQIKTQFPEVFNPAKRSRIIKHSIVASVAPKQIKSLLLELEDSAQTYTEHCKVR